MTIKMIIATDHNFGIGINNSIPWDCPSDMKYFKEQTLNGIVVMGRKTFESLPFENGLPYRSNYIISKQNVDPLMGYTIVCDDSESSVVWCNLKGLMCWMRGWSIIEDSRDIWVIGGASIYKELLPLVEEIHHTIIDGVYYCDTHFNMEFLEDWELIGGKDLCENAVVNIWRRN